ncbi:MAG: ABC transporter ATP-binding protein [Chloroflexaceae bacterium]|jgi:lipopolysaccharide transport system ATP-binding protein|nr:ABC transporter ATP-binding protein [Chloroflexaceae bacterium]
MTSLAIRVENLAKEYHIGVARGDYATLRDRISHMLQAPFARFGAAGQARAAAEQFWALRDVSFEVQPGEVVGIVGRNGAGKSTLLKILSRITEPTRGRAAIYGRVGSLLEVGSGFHPELTGRENIYLNGAILGMRKAEIDRKFDEIVAFAEVERFLDTQVKFYSSGMYVRLAFAVAAHLEPEILIVDEVLAVGDAAFQKKCLNKMQDVGHEGRTVLFVSHNLPAVTRLCDRAILLRDGVVALDGSTHQVVGAYLNAGNGTSAERLWPDPATAPGGAVARLRAMRVRNEAGQVTDTFDIRQPVYLEMEYEVLQDGAVLLPHYWLENDEGVNIFSLHDVDPEWRQRPRPAGWYRSTAVIPGNLLAEGVIYVNPAIITLNPNVAQFDETYAVSFNVADAPAGADTARGDWTGKMYGVVRPLCQWQTEFKPTE